MNKFLYHSISALLMHVVRELFRHAVYSMDTVALRKMRLQMGWPGKGKDPTNREGNLSATIPG